MCRMVRTTKSYKRAGIRDTCKDHLSTCSLDMDGKRLRFNVGRSWVLVEGHSKGGNTCEKTQKLGSKISGLSRVASACWQDQLHRCATHAVGYTGLCLEGPSIWFNALLLPF